FRVLLLHLLILRLELVVSALRDAGGEEDRRHEREQQDAVFQTISHCFQSPQLDDRHQGRISGGPILWRPPCRRYVYCPEWLLIISSTCFFTASRLNEAGSCIGG